MSDERQRWDERYRAAELEQASPAEVVLSFQHLLPQQGEALDLACGLGANALLLAQHGLHTHAWDSSGVAIDKLSVQAKAMALPIQAEVRDVIAHPPHEHGFDVIVVSRFLERSLCPAIASALRPGGLLFYQTFVRDKSAGVGPSNPAYLLARNELLHLFSQLELIAYREEGLVGDLGHGVRNEAWLVAQRPKD